MSEKYQSVSNTSFSDTGTDKKQVAGYTFMRSGSVDGDVVMCW